MKVYCVAYHTNDSKTDAILGGLWGVYSTRLKAYEAVCYWIDLYNEELQDAYELPNGISRYECRTGYYLIEAVEMDAV